jgi:parallel beta-helix repeat protein
VGNNFCGVEFHGSYDSCYGNVVSGNNVTENVEDGIKSRGSYNTTVTGNSVTNNQRNAIHFYKSPDAYIVGNFVTGNIEVTKSDNSTVEQNDAEIPDDEIPDSVPEFPQWAPLLIMLIAVLGVASVYKRSLNKQNLRRKIL